MPAILPLTRQIRDRADLGPSVSLQLVALVGLLTKPIQHRLFWRFCRRISRRLQGYTAVVRLGDDSQIKISLDDPYWLRLVARHYVYEPEIAHLLLRFRDIPFVFVDCGANVGLWSILASSAEYGAHPTIAIEGSARICQTLEENCTLNSGRFRVIHAAVAEVSGTSTWFKTGDDPAGSSLYDVSGSVRFREEVTTIALDDLPIDGTALIKLDVEGAEVPAMRGGRKLLAKQQTLLCYEDHGSEPSCAPTQAALDLGLAVFWIAPNGTVRAIPSIDAVRRIKTRRSYGYNFIACPTGSVFADRLRA